MATCVQEKLIHAQEYLLLSGVIGAFNYALDLTEGQPPGTACVAAGSGLTLARRSGSVPNTRGIAITPCC